jgi:predicted PurR-regulated permease PerM
VAVRLAGERGPRLVELALRTTRNVARGVIGTALIQATLVGLGLVAAEVPGAAFLTLISFVLCVVQVGPAIVLLGAAVYVFTSSGLAIGILFLAWSVAVGTSDSLLRPLLMSRGGDAPAPVILIGTLGGLIAHGLIGLFVGPVVFALGYRMFQAWVAGHELSDWGDPGRPRSRT